MALGMHSCKRSGPLRAQEEQGTLQPPWHGHPEQPTGQLAEDGARLEHFEPASVGVHCTEQGVQALTRCAWLPAEFFAAFSDCWQ